MDVDIMAVCDIFDALITDRPYRSAAYVNLTAIEELTETGENNVLNPDVIKALVSINRKEKHHFSDCEVSHEKRGHPPLFNNYGLIDIIVNNLCNNIRRLRG